MRNRVERLRIYLLGSAILLVVVIGAFIGTARYLRRHLLAGLPAKLGINVESDASGWTYSQSRGSQTLYTIHAAKWEKRTDGKMVLHDVSILLYGQKGSRHDRIYGDEFEYDKDAGVVRATGVVHLDLQSADSAAKAPQGDDSGAKLMHVKTSGLVYLEKLGVAATSDYIEFQGGGMTGHATGADYSSDSGMLTLHSAVDMSGTTGGHPVSLKAATAEFNNQSQQAHMTHATYDSQGRTAAADDVTLYRRTDGTLSRVEAHGNVTGQAKSATVVSQHTDIALTATGQPQTAVLTGGVRYSSDGPLRQMKGEADAATISFDGQAKPQPEHALFAGTVHVTERTRATEAAKEPWSTRDLTAARLDVALGRGVKGDAQLRDVVATGTPKLSMVSNGTTELSGDDLRAHLIASADPKQGPQVDTIVGLGHTLLRQMSVDGIEQTTAGDTLNAKMRPVMGAGLPSRSVAQSAAGKSIADGLLNAVQTGHVTMMRRSPAKSKAGAKTAAHDDVEQATAQRAVYDGDQDRVTLTGSVSMSDAGSGLWADQVALDHKTGDAHAIGGVKMNYAQDAAVGRSGGQQDQPTHILADRAELQHATQVATFYGKPVRMWQGGNQMQAPEIEFARETQRLIARGEGSTGWSAATQASQVHTVLASAQSDAAAGTLKGAGLQPCSATAKAASGKNGAGVEEKSPDVVRIASGGLIYSGILRQADFTGGFRADTVDGTIRAGAGTVYLQKAASPVGADAAGLSLAGGLDHFVAAGQVELDKPGMHATGERLVYTASDRIVLLTGDAKAPPKAVGASGTTTGTTLRFNSCDGSVEALGVAGERVLTDARISNEEKKEQGKR